MRQGSPSATAQKVAAYRVGFERQPAPFGDPEADLRLSTDVAGGSHPDQELMARYLQARTRFFDRCLLNALDRGTTQVALVGAGYDGRAWRYAKPGVKWFEIDHPATQADKRSRLERLGLSTPDVTFIAADFAQGGLADAMAATGFDARLPSFLMCEGVAVYLDRPILAAVLGDLRAVSAYGSRLAISFSVATDTVEGAAQRQRFAEGVGALGEPARTVLGADEAAALLSTSGWAVREISERARRAGFVVAEAAWTPRAGGEGQAPAPGSLEDLMERIGHRAGTEGLAGHLERTYGAVVSGLVQLDLGVYRVDRADGPSWVARLFARTRPLEDVQGDADILARMAEQGYPAERLARPEAVSVHEGQGVLVTEFVPGPKPEEDVSTYRMLGDLLGRLHASDSVPVRPGGGWHHLVHQGTVDDEINAARSLADAAGARVPPGQEPLYERLKVELGGDLGFVGLPEALVHPDFVPPNAVLGPGGLVIVDWAGAGRGPRLASLGFLLWVAGAQGQACVDSVVAGYRAHIELEAGELDFLEAAIAFRRLTLQAWSFCVGRQSLPQVVDRFPAARAHARAVAARVRHLYSSDFPRL